MPQNGAQKRSHAQLKGCTGLLRGAKKLNVVITYDAKLRDVGIVEFCLVPFSADGSCERKCKQQPVSICHASASRSVGRRCGQLQEEHK